MNVIIILLVCFLIMYLEVQILFKIKTIKSVK
jgi:hypothetical protein